MAKSIETYQSELIASKESKPELQAADSTSGTALWRLMTYVVAVALFLFDSMLDLFKIEIETTLNTLKPGTLLWYQDQCKKFQYGDNLIWSNGKWNYQTIDESKRIVTQCSVTEGNGGLVIKIATGTGDLNPLSTLQLNAFIAYIKRIKYAGTKISIINSIANSLKIYAVIFYDPLIIAADGKSLDDATYVFENAINNYLLSLPFNGRLKKTSITDACLAVTGCEDIKLTSVEQKYASNPYSNIDVGHTPESGYFKVDLAHQLRTTLQYVANV